MNGARSDGTVTMGYSRHYKLRDEYVPEIPHPNRTVFACADQPFAVVKAECSHIVSMAIKHDDLRPN
jgi:hypothetical protein